MKTYSLPCCGVSREKDVWAEGLLGSAVIYVYIKPEDCYFLFFQGLT